MKKAYIIRLLLMGIGLLFQSCQCEPRIQDDRRMLIKGSIVDGANNPIPNISVSSQKYTETLGKAITDANGQFEFTSLDVEDQYTLAIRVNVKNNNLFSYNYDHIYDQTENPEYSGKNYYNNSTSRAAATYNLGKIQLNKAARLDVLFNNIPGDTNSVSYKIEYQSAICDVDFTTPIYTEDCLFNDDYYNQLDVNTTNFQTDIYSQLGTTVLFKYILNNEPEQTISIPLTNPENSYVFEY